MGAQGLGQGVAQALLVRAALRRGNGVAIGVDEGVDRRRPGYRPFHRPAAIFVFGAAGEVAAVDGVGLADFAFEKIQQPAGEFQRVFRRGLVLDQRRIASPANLHAPEQIGFGLGHAIKPRRRELHVAEDLHVGLEGDDRAPAIDRADLLELALRLTAFEAHLVAALVTRHIHFHPFRKRVDHRGPDAVQAATGLIGLAVEFAAGMQRGHDHFQRRLVLEFRMRVHRNAAAIVANRQHIVRSEFHLDAAGMTGNRFVHGIVQNLGGKVMQRADVGTADIHAGAAAHGFQALENLDVLGGIRFGSGTGGGEQVLGVFGHSRIVKSLRTLTKHGVRRTVFLYESHF